MGRPRKSAEEHLRNGTYRPSRHGPLAPPVDESPDRPPKKPADLSGEAAELWDVFLRLLAGVVRERHGPALREACWWLAEARRIQRAIENTPPGLVEYNRLLIAAGIAADKFAAATKVFGLTPADQAKLRADMPTGPAKPKVMTRPRTKLDKQGKPK